MGETPFSIRREVIHVPMRDGVKLSVHVHRPDTAERYPVILSYTPYRKGPIGAHHPIVEHGYATVTFDIRGTGNSEGHNDSIYSAEERQDGYDMVEWAASRPWSTGNVGMWGISFGAVVSLQMAGAAPPSLKAIIARSGTDDPYTDWTNPGGSPRPYMYMDYAAIMTAANFAPPDPAEVGDRWEAIWKDRLADNVPWGIPFAQNLLDGPFWRQRSLRGHYDKVKCPVFVVGGWADWYPSSLLRIYANLKCPRRALIGPWSHQWPDTGFPGPRVEWLPEALRWFDCWLKGIDNGLKKEPPVTIFVREFSKPGSVVLQDRGTFRCEREWPIVRTKPTPMYLHCSGKLDVAKPDLSEVVDRVAHDPRAGVSTGFYGGGPFNVNCAMPLDQRSDDATSLAYTSDPLEAPLEVTGIPRLVLHVSSDARTALVAAKLCDVAADGTTALVTTGSLTLNHRESHSHPADMEPGRIYRIEIDCLDCAYLFAEGHRIRIYVATADLMNLWPTPARGSITVYRDAQRPSCVILPVIPPPTSPLPSHGLRLMPAPVDEKFEAAGNEHSIHQDLIRHTAKVQYKVFYGPNWWNSAELIVSAEDPARTEIRSSSRLKLDYPGRQVTTDVSCVTTSDDTTFRHVVHLAITMNGNPHSERNWDISVPRTGF